MDSLTHIAVGACIGEAMAGKSVGRKAMLWGVLAHSLPDIDFITAFWMDHTDNLISHRGFTHSLVFLCLASPLLAGFANRIHLAQSFSYGRWLRFFLVAIGLHIFLDTFNNYGIGIFEPFSSVRFSFNTLYVVDPLFSIAPLIAMIVLLFKRGLSASRAKWWKFGMGVAGLYLCYALVNKAHINHDVVKSLDAQQIEYDAFFTTPAPFQTWLWFVVVNQDTTLKIGYRSVFDKKEEVTWRTIERNENLLRDFEDSLLVSRLKTFSQGFYSGEMYGDTLVLNDFRFGQEVGWHDSLGRIAFHYYLNFPEENSLVVQRGRFARWDKKTVREFINRIKGN